MYVGLGLELIYMRIQHSSLVLLTLFQRGVDLAVSVAWNYLIILDICSL